MGDLHNRAAEGGNAVEYHLVVGGQPRGPYTVEQLARSGVAADTMVWADGMPDWLPADRVPALAGLLDHQPPAMGSPQQADRIWTVHDQGRQFGPHTLAEIAMLAGAGTISPAAMIWQAGSPQWLPAASMVPMPSRAAHAPAYPAGPYTSGPYTSGPPRATNKIPAGIFGILLGGLGIHKFILGFTGAGLTMLLVTVLTCGYGGIVMGVIGLIEGIIYLCKSDADFHRDYVVRRQSWF